MKADTAVAVIGAGPYGLAVAAHLRDRGVDHTVFGEPLGYWERHMPAGMRLRSSWRASSIASPRGRWSLAAFERERGEALDRPVPLRDFLAYGRWYQQAAVPHVERSRVEDVARLNGHFGVRLADGQSMTAQRVVLATGLERFARRPAPFADLRSDRVTHTADHRDLGRFSDRDLLVVGGGQSAIEFAALARGAGARVTVLMRAANVHWLTRSARLHGGRWAVGRLLYAPTDVGPAGLSWAVAAPGAMRRIPRALRRRATVRCVRPAASAWLHERLEGARLVTGRQPVAAEVAGGGVAVRLDDGSALHADDVVLGTGFEPSLAAAGVVAPTLLDDVAIEAGLPVLRRGFETSVPGLHVVGALAAGSYGPVMRFVSGTWYTAPAVADAAART